MTMNYSKVFVRGNNLWQTVFACIILFISCNGFLRNNNNGTLPLGSRQIAAPQDSTKEYKFCYPKEMRGHEIEGYLFVAKSVQKKTDGLVVNSFDLKEFGIDIEEFTESSYNIILDSRGDSVDLLSYSVVKLSFLDRKVYYTGLVTKQNGQFVSTLTFYIKHDDILIAVIHRSSFLEDMEIKDDFFWDILYCIEYENIPLVKPEDLVLISSEFLPVGDE